MVASRSRVIAGVLCLVVGSVFQFVQFLVSPMKEADSASSQVAAAVAHPAAMRLAVVLDLPMLLLIPATLFAGWVAGAGRSRLATVGTGILFTSFLGAGYLLAQDVVVYAAAQHSVGPVAAQIVSGFENNHALIVIVAIYLVGHVVGSVLLGIALARSGAVPAWAGLALCAWPFAEVAGEASGAAVLAAVGFALLAVAFGACAWALKREASGVAATEVPGLSRMSV